MVTKGGAGKSMKRILAILIRDVKSGTREFLFLYIMLAPIIIAIGLRLFIPSVNAVSFQFALDGSLNPEVIETFERYGKVEILEGRADIESRVDRTDDIIGVTKNEDGKYVVILEGNEEESSKYIAQQILAGMEDKTTDIEISFSDIGRSMSSIAVYGATSVIIMAIVLSGMVIGLNIVEEKESRTISALRVSPMGRMEFIFGKSLIGLLLPIVETLIILRVLGITDIDLGMALVMTVASSFVAVIMGFLMGVLSSNQISAIANMKFLLIIVSGSVIGAIVMPQNLHVFLYWSPLYWSTIGLVEIITNTAAWSNIAVYTLWITALSALVFLSFKRRIAKGLA